MAHRILRKTKIIATIGPASDSVDTIKAMIRAGMNVARLNFSHGTHAEHRKRIETIRPASAALGTPIAILLDTRGAAIRTGRLDGRSATLPHGQTCTLQPHARPGDPTCVAPTSRTPSCPSSNTPATFVRLPVRLRGLDTFGFFPPKRLVKVVFRPHSRNPDSRGRPNGVLFVRTPFLGSYGA